MRISDLSFRQMAAAGAAACAGLLAYGYYLQYFEGQDPCPLHQAQRAGILALEVLQVIAAGQEPGARRSPCGCQLPER